MNKTPINPAPKAASPAGLLCKVAAGVLLAVLVCSRSAAAQIPCGGYQIAAIIQAPPCPFTGPPATIGAAISPNGRYVCGQYAQCEGYTESFVFDMTTDGFSTLPRPAGILTSLAEDVSNDGLVVGRHDGAGFSYGYIYNLKTDQYTNLPALHPSGICVVTAINENGQCCGTRGIAGAPNYPTNAFVYDIASATYTDLGVMNGPSSGATDISDQGIVVGWTGTTTFTANKRGFVYEDGTLTILDPIPGGLSSLVNSVNQSNAFVGRGLVPSQEFGNVSHALIGDSKGEVIDIGTLPGYRHSFAYDLSEDGVVVGFCRMLADGSDSLTGYIWTNGVMVDLNDLIEPDSALHVDIAWSISDDGQITGQGIIQEGNVVAFVLAPLSPAQGDSNCDTFVNVDDLLNVINHWGPCTGCASDFNQDKIVNVTDLMFVIENWTLW